MNVGRVTADMAQVGLVLYGSLVAGDGTSATHRAASQTTDTPRLLTCFIASDVTEPVLAGDDGIVLREHPVSDQVILAWGRSLPQLSAEGMEDIDI